jgi:prepilin peptidase CpaA
MPVLMPLISNAPDLLAVALAASALVAAARADLTSYQIPNRYALAIALAFFFIAVDGGWHAAFLGLAAGAVTFGLGTVLFAKGWLGGGDVKLISAVALWVAPPLLAPFALITSLAGAILSIAMLTPLRRCLPAPPADLAPETGLRQPIPYGVAIAAGGLFVLLKRVTG